MLGALTRPRHRLVQYAIEAYYSGVRDIRRFWKRTGLLLALLSCAPSAWAQPEPFIVDLASGSESFENSIVSHFATLRDLDFFVARNAHEGARIWVTDKRPGGTRVLTSLPPTSRFLPPRAVGEIDGLLYILVRDAGNDELWKTDGTSTGTLHVATIGRDGARTTALAFDNGVAYFAMSSDPQGEYFWRSDGTAEGTNPASEYCTAEGSCRAGASSLWIWSERMLYIHDDVLYSLTAGHPAEFLYGAPRDDGACPNCEVLAPIGDKVVFLGPEGSLWIADGTRGGTRPVLLGNVRPRIIKDGWVLHDGALYAVTSSTLFRVDGDGSQAERVTSFIGFDRCVALTAARDDLVVVLDYRWGLSTILYRFNPDTRDHRRKTLPHGSVSNVQALGTDGGVFVLATHRVDSRNQRFLWYSDLTSSEPRLLADFETAQPLRSAGQEVRLIASSSSSFLNNLWASDGTVLGTRVIHDPLPEVSAPLSSNPILQPSDGESLLFTFTESNEDTSIGGYDDNVVARLLTPVRPASVALRIDERLLHLTTDHRLALGETTLAESIAWTPVARRIGGRVYLGFSRSDGHLDGIMTTDLTPEGNRFLGWDSCFLGAPCPPPYYGPFWIEPLGDKILFDRDDGLYAASANLDSHERLLDQEVFGFVSSGDRGYFATRSDTPALGWYVGVTDGTSSGTVPFARDAGGEPIVSPGVPPIVRWQGEVCFFHPWKTDATAPVMWCGSGDQASVRSILEVPDFEITKVGSAVSTSSTMFFSASDDQQNSAIFATDGTTTRRVAPAVANLSGDTAILTTGEGEPEEWVVFTGWDAEGGYEPWVTDGTETGTFRIADINPGPTHSYPSQYTITDDRLFFSAENPEVGRELFIISIDALFATPEIIIEGDTAATEDEAVSLRAVASAPLEQLCWRFGDEPTIDQSCTATGAEVSHVYDEPGEYEVTLVGERTLPRGTVQSATATRNITVETSCPACVRDDRFVVTVDWSLPSGQRGVGTPVAFSDDTVLFWFFDESNIELAVKVLDGTTINDYNWVIYGSLSDVAYTVVVEDTLSGETRSYDNAPGNYCGGIDVEALPARISSPTEPPQTVSSAGTAGSSCSDDPDALCLQNGRFEVTASFFDVARQSWRDARPIPWTDESGMFWFFSPGNVEMLVKILDGRAVNGHHWLYYGGLSDVEYRLEVMDTLTGRTTSLINPAGEICGGAFVDVLPGSSLP